MYLATTKLFRWILLIFGDEIDRQGGHRMNSLMLSQHPSIRRLTSSCFRKNLLPPNMPAVQKYIRLALVNNMDILPGLLSDIIDAWTEHSLSWCLGRPCQSLLREFSSSNSSRSSSSSRRRHWLAALWTVQKFAVLCHELKCKCNKV